ncbi:hypothetical protein VCHA53O466_50399 [Vibrio chagasii]|nr:hypothetical protein VCHA53O466_50399 [Vibrio chagasii]
MTKSIYVNTPMPELMDMFFKDDERLEGASLNDIVRNHEEHYFIPLEKRDFKDLLDMQVADLDNIEPLKAVLSHTPVFFLKNSKDLIEQIPHELFEKALPTDLSDVELHNLKADLGKRLGIELFVGLERIIPEPECTEQVQALKDKVWYRGMKNFPMHSVTKGRSDSAVFITDNPLQAATYAGKDGYIAEVKLTSDFFVVDHEPRMGSDFSILKFHEEAVGLIGTKHGVVASDVVDSGPFPISDFGAETEKEYYSEGSVNIGMHHDNSIAEAVVLRPALEVVNEHMAKKQAVTLTSSPLKMKI